MATNLPRAAGLMPGPQAAEPASEVKVAAVTPEPKIVLPAPRLEAITGVPEPEVTQAPSVPDNVNALLAIKEAMIQRNSLLT